MSSEVVWDVVVVGGGVAGCSAALYTARRELKTLTIAKDEGQLGMAVTVENYPGIESESGSELSMRFKKHAEKSGAKFILDTVRKISKTNNGFVVYTVKKEYKARSVILAFGKSPRRLKIPGEKEFLGRGVSYCATCDGPLFKNKVITVVGGGNTAIAAAEYLSGITKQVYLIHRRNEFRAEPQALKRVFTNKKIKVFEDTVLKEIKGSNFVENVNITNLKTKKVQEFKVDGVFVEIGYEVRADFVKDFVDQNQLGEIRVNTKGETRTRGVFAAGDLTPILYKQAIIAAGSGVVAALGVWEHLACDKANVIDQ